MGLPSFDEVYMSGVGLLIPMFLNWRTHRPIKSRLYLFPLWGGIGFVAGRAVKNIRNDYYIQKMNYIEEYIRLHPEEFPEEMAPKKYKDVLLPWHPVR